jgi:DNA-binding response OmpR family regulator
MTSISSTVVDATDQLNPAANRCRPSPPLVLCIDDDREIAKIWQLRLATRGVAVESAVNGVDGFKAAMEKCPDLILLDLCLPGEDGDKVLARLRRHPKTRHVPVVMLTGSDQSSARRASSQDRADDYLTKPVNFADLLARIEVHLRANSVVRPTS